MVGVSESFQDRVCEERWQWSVQRVDRECSTWIVCIKLDHGGSKI